MKHLIEVGALGGLLVVALVGTYVTYHSDAQPEDGKGTAVYVAAVEDLQSVTYSSDDKSVLIERKSDELGEFLWLTVTERTTTMKEIEAPPEDTDISDISDISDTDDTDEPGGAEFEEVVEESTKSFLGNAQADTLWESFAPFKAARELPVDSDSSGFGFDEPYGTITVARKSGSIKLTLGSPTFGERSRYMQAEQRNFLVEKKALSRIESAGTSLPERRLHPLKYEDIASVTATWEGQTSTWTHQNPDDKVRNYWAIDGQPDTNARIASRWLSKAVRASAQEYLAEPPEGLSAVLSLKLTDGNDTWTVDVSSDGGDPAAYYATSAYNRSMVKITPSQGEDLVVDAKSAFEDTGAAPEEAPE